MVRGNNTTSNDYNIHFKANTFSNIKILVNP